ncbi:hypothetical protein MUU53_21490 [Rhizobium lemnae]|uniref:Rhodanese-like domain-containing protein n=1 Tax=Rhizobium lemnae TaxID=1214924 RepID=A0ABV8EE76_9HYPH|nr:rhodanese-like domain-containing protein [Rhizobium lemnae]MCJ8510447.1 hypothetical protein [Rhizobium lemnae]
MTHQIEKKTFMEWLADGQKLAVLDIRPAEEVGYASPLFATNLPADRLFADIDRFIPRRSIRTVLLDDGKGGAVAAAEALSKNGWGGIHALEGGIPAWTEKGTDNLPTFDVPGVPFVTKIRDENKTPVVSAAELQAWRDAGEDLVVIDTRTLAEFEKSHVPGGNRNPRRRATAAIAR